MISRHWKGIARPGQAEWYVDHLRRDIFPKLAALPGFVRATIPRREVADGTEFQGVTAWQSPSAVPTFGGKDPGVAAVPAVVQAMMAPCERDVVHYELADTRGPVARAR